MAIWATDWLATGSGEEGGWLQPGHSVIGRPVQEPAIGLNWVI